jgi:hypothetical protein
MKMRVLGSKAWMRKLRARGGIAVLQTRYPEAE